MNVSTHRYLLVLTALAWTLFSLSCATVDPSQDYSRAHELIEQTTGVQQVHDPDAKPLTSEQIEQIFADGLSIDQAVQLALLNNRKLQAAFMEIGIARADWVQSGLLKNPNIGAAVLFPVDGGRSMVEAGIAQNIIDLWQIPIKKEIAQRGLDMALLRLARHAGILVARTRKAYHQAVAALQLHALAKQNLALLRQSYDAVDRKNQAGAASPFDLNLALGQLLNAQLELQQSQLKAANAKRRLAQLFSLDHNIDGLVLIDKLPNAQLGELDAASLIQMARARRPDLRVYEAAFEAAGRQVALQYKKAFGQVAIGADVERESATGKGDVKAGPGISFDVPIFDQNQAQVARVRYLQNQAKLIYEQSYLSVAQDIRIGIDNARAGAQAVAFYREKLLPQAEKSLDFASKSYQAGQINTLILLQAQRASLGVRRGFITAQHQAADALVELQLLTASTLDSGDVNE